MGYSKVDRTLEESGVAVDIFSDATLFVKVRAARSKAVEKVRTKVNQPYRNIIMAGRPLPPGVQAELNRKVAAQGVIVGIAGTISDDEPERTTFGKIENGVPVEFGKPDDEEMEAILFDYPDFGEDVATASYASATYASEAEQAVVDAHGESSPSQSEAEGEAAGNSQPS